MNSDTMTMMMQLDRIPEFLPGQYCPVLPGKEFPVFPQGPGGTNFPPNNNDIREMIFRMAVMQPIHIDPESVKPPKRRNVRISKDPQSVAARQRRERISERIRILQRLVPGGTKMDTASMLDEAVHYVKFLKKQVQSLENAAMVGGSGFGKDYRAFCRTDGGLYLDA